MKLISAFVCLLLLFSATVVAQGHQMALGIERPPETVINKLSRIFGERKSSLIITPKLKNIGTEPLIVLCGSPSLIKMPSKRASYVYSILPIWEKDGIIPVTPTLDDLRPIKLLPDAEVELAPIQTIRAEDGLPEGKFQVRYYVDPYFRKALGAWVGELRAEARADLQESGNK